MISKKTKLYCCEDFSLIENYDKAINDMNEVYEVHHRLETDLNLSGKELIDLGLYYDRPADELIFLTHGEHTSLHNKHGNGFKTNKPIVRTEEWNKKISISHLGSNNPMYERKWMVKDNKEETLVDPENIEEYKQNGWIIGRIKGRTPGNKGQKDKYRWMIKDDKPELINKDDIQKYLDDGWRFGRK